MFSTISQTSAQMQMTTVDAASMTVPSIVPGFVSIYTSNGKFTLFDGNTTGRGKEFFVSSSLDGNAIHRNKYAGYGAFLNLPLQYFREANYPGDIYFTTTHYAREHDRDWHSVRYGTWRP
ncbi:hypothetical protein MGU_09455 [Metarhizium guizhouense ARSEF 977]|uniref:Uncharacterized protein n=1 Tax=Metarhizium guizhouense (strain ARSEF 977) TaxID=1276136 RepID=A0A0B4G969_METGA|nr:hypothetical protein MGU_09455 [Metarhizium guizhouense ARSEF 977]